MSTLRPCEADFIMKLIRFMVLVYVCLAGLMLIKHFANPDYMQTHLYVPILFVACALGIPLTFFYAKYDLESFGIENIQRLGANLSAEWRDRVWQTGKMTLSEWVKAKRMINQ